MTTRRITRRWCSACIVAGALALSGCDPLFGPTGRTEIYVLTEVGGQSTVVLHGESLHEEFRVTSGGTLEVGGWCGPWRFEKVVPSAP